MKESKMREQRHEYGGGTMHNYRRIRNRFNGDCKKVQNVHAAAGVVSPPKSAPLPRKTYAPVPPHHNGGFEAGFNNGAAVAPANSASDLRFVRPDFDGHAPSDLRATAGSNWSINGQYGKVGNATVGANDYSELRTIVRRIEREQQRMNNSRNVDCAAAPSMAGAASSGSSSGSLKKSPRFCRKKKLPLDFVNG